MTFWLTTLWIISVDVPLKSSPSWSYSRGLGMLVDMSLSPSESYSWSKIKKVIEGMLVLLSATGSHSRPHSRPSFFTHCAILERNTPYSNQSWSKLPGQVPFSWENKQPQTGFDILRCHQWVIAWVLWHSEHGTHIWAYPSHLGHPLEQDQRWFEYVCV